MGNLRGDPTSREKSCWKHGPPLDFEHHLHSVQATPEFYSARYQGTIGDLCDGIADPISASPTQRFPEEDFLCVAH